MLRSSHQVEIMKRGKECRVRERRYEKEWQEEEIGMWYP